MVNGGCSHCRSRGARMTSPWNRLSIRHRIVAVFLAATTGACASTPAASPRTQVHLEPPKATSVETAPLPSLPPLSTDAAISDGYAPRLSTLTAVNQDLGLVIRELAGKFGLQYQIDPDVRGIVNTTLHNKTLVEALAAIVPLGMTYQIKNGVLRVAQARVETRIFSLDYVAVSRVGTASSVITRRLGTSAIGGAAGAGAASGAGAGGLGAAGAGADVISAVSVADVWEEIRVAVEALVFETPVAAQSAAAPASVGGGALGGANRPYSRTAADGRRLIVNPIAGSI